MISRKRSVAAKMQRFKSVKIDFDELERKQEEYHGRAEHGK